ncbi:hypothetical protein BZA05DRAFT_172697 [Tricharina praecox]|uniref:uncharacterized protein n=1 Tax=Tricharina praecox TaxID=43433 RepID=UPI00221FE947|nr:uncharacterized protein BZA05DRAFT_172697 [Tricharina praecox]KAI5844260.1 hypothetical protein BZA05DRAFT_172697 [Tricharina praecox]
MKFTSTLITFGLIAFAAAQTTTSSAAASQITQSEQQKCVTSCDGNLTCTAECLGNPAPTEDMVNATTQCAMKCEQGDGTETQTKKYADCQQKCISDNFFVNPSGASGAASRASASATGVIGASGTGTRSSPTASGSAADASGSSAPNAAGHLAVSGAAGVIALIVAAVAL